MNLSAAVDLRSEGRVIQAKGLKQDMRFQPVHAGAHAHFTKVGYIHTGNKTRGGMTTSNYFKTKGGNSRHVAVQADGSYTKMSQTAKGAKKSRGKLDAKGMKCHNVSEEMKPVTAGGPGSGRHPGGGAKPTWGDNTTRTTTLNKMHDFAKSKGGEYDHTATVGKGRFSSGDTHHVYKDASGKTTAIIHEDPDGHHQFLTPDGKAVDTKIRDAYNSATKKQYDAIDKGRHPDDKVSRSSFLD